jgi:hypothetical protein
VRNFVGALMFAAVVLVALWALRWVYVTLVLSSWRRDALASQGGTDGDPVSLRRESERVWRARWSVAARQAAPARFPLLSETDGLVLGPVVPWFEGETVSREAVEGSALVVPAEAVGRHLIVIGDTGAGKTILLQRLSLAEAVRKRDRGGGLTILVDCKGGPDAVADGLAWAQRCVDYGLAPQRVGMWPVSVALDLWAMQPDDLASTLYGMFGETHEYYDTLRRTAVRLAVCGGRKPASAQEFMRNLSAEWLRQEWAHDATVAGVLRALTHPASAAQLAPIEDIRLKYWNLFQELGPSFVGGGEGAATLADYDALYCVVPGTRRPEVARAAASAILAMVVDALAREDSDRRPITLIVDEYSAVAGALSLADAVERLRSLGGSVVAAAQSWEGLGPSDTDRKRMLHAASGGLLLMRSKMPGPVVVAAAGTAWRPEVAVTDSIEGDYRTTTRVVEVPALDPARLRAALPGDVAYCRAGQVTWGRVVEELGPARAEIRQRRWAPTPGAAVPVSLAAGVVTVGVVWSWLAGFGLLLAVCLVMARRGAARRRPADAWAVAGRSPVSEGGDLDGPDSWL